MIDSTPDPPKELRETVTKKLSNLVILSLLIAVCACAASTPPPPHSDSAASPETAPTSNPAEPSDADDGDGQASAPAESNDAPTAEEEEARSKPQRTVLKTVYDDRRVGEDQTSAIEAELGLVDDEDLLDYVRSVGIRLVRHAPPRPFDYEFMVVDESVPNAFALPGGKIYVSRGLLALVETEDELAGVIGHEITHAAERHAAARIDYSSRINPFSIGLLRAAEIAAYGRDQERDADRGGQILAARAGYDPAGISTFLRKLDASDRYELGWSRLPYFLATHPTSPERSALASDRAAGLDWERQPGVADDLPLAYYSAIDGLILGDNPAGGLFEGSRFIHPDLRFAIRFPRGWTTANGQQAVAAMSPMRDAQATLTVEGPGPDIAKVVDEFIDKEVDGIRMKVRDRREVKLGDLPAIRIEGKASSGLAGLSVQMTFVAHGGLVYRLSIISLSSAASKYRGRGRAFAHSFRPLDDEGAYSLKITRLRIARALENETLEALSTRTHNELELVYTGVMNDLYASTSLAKGTPVKIGLAEPYIPEPMEESAADTPPETESKTR
jgi:predicted Zn-dependent protease